MASIVTRIVIRAAVLIATFWAADELGRRVFTLDESFLPLLAAIAVTAAVAAVWGFLDGRGSRRAMDAVVIWLPVVVATRLVLPLVLFGAETPLGKGPSVVDLMLMAGPLACAVGAVSARPGPH